MNDKSNQCQSAVPSLSSHLHLVFNLFDNERLTFYGQNSWKMFISLFYSFIFKTQLLVSSGVLWASLNFTVLK